MSLAGVLLAVSEHEADDKLEAVAILREKSRPQPRDPTTPRHLTVLWRRYSEGLRGGLKVPPEFLQTLNRDEICGLFRGNVTKEPDTEFFDCKYSIIGSIRQFAK